VHPNTDHAPAEILRRFLHVSIVLSVSENFCAPIFQTGTGTLIAARAAVPKTTVHKYNDTSLLKKEVRFSRKFLISTPAGDFTCSEQFDKPQFSRRISVAAYAGHDLARYPEIGRVRLLPNPEILRRQVSRGISATHKNAESAENRHSQPKRRFKMGREILRKHDREQLYSQGS